MKTDYERVQAMVTFDGNTGLEVQLQRASKQFHEVEYLLWWCAAEYGSFVRQTFAAVQSFHDGESRIHPKNNVYQRERGAQLLLQLQDAEFMYAEGSERLQHLRALVSGNFDFAFSKAFRSKAL